MKHFLLLLQFVAPAGERRIWVKVEELR